MQSLKRYHSAQNDGTRLQLTTATHDVFESSDSRILSVISEHPVVIFARPACYMCHVMRNLLSTIGAYPIVIEFDDKVELKALPEGETAAVYVGGERVGGLEMLVGMHLSGRLVPTLIEAGALSKWS